MLKRATNEFFVRYMDEFHNYQDIFNTSCKTWNDTAKNQLRRKMIHVENVWENEDSRIRYFDIAFQNGSKAYFLFVPRHMPTFDLHESIREAFKDGLKEHNNISVNLLSIEEDLQEKCVVALSSAIHLYQWDYPKYGKKSKRNKKASKDFGFYTTLSNNIIEDKTWEGQVIAEGTNLARTLCVTPTNYMTSKHLVEEGRKIAKRHYGVKFNFVNESKLKELKAGAFLAVIQGSKGSDGGIVHLSYRTRAKDKPTIALIGKGVVFDTGGYDVKTDGSMEGMHRDMTGAAIALSTFQALVRNKIKANIDLYLAVGENLVSETAYKPNDVVIDMNGTSIEVINTDAEGRMLLVDTINYANKSKPDLMIDFATLTGDAVSAIDNRYACVFSNDDILSARATIIGMESGERVWHFPTTSDFSRGLSSDVADIRQCQEGINAEHIYAACFLKYFAKETPWIHVDLSAEISENGLGLVDTCVTGFGVRWGYEFVKHYLGESDE